MPTFGWIQETSDDRYWETGSDPDAEPIASVYDCRICGMSFGSIAERDQHEVSHPIHNPVIFLQGKEAAGEVVEITSSFKEEDILLKNIDFLCVNGKDCEVLSVFFDILMAESTAFLDVVYGNASLERRVKIKVCIADPDELNSVDEAFIQCFEVSGVNDLTITSFSEKVRKQKTVLDYGDGLVRYLQGVMIKDNRSDYQNFEVFFERFNQATYSLRNYDTGLSRAVKAVVNFNRNDFASVGISGIAELDSATAFFLGGEFCDNESKNCSNPLPVDSATAYIVTELLPIYKDGSLSDLESEINMFPPTYLSLQDKMKFKFICWAKANKDGNFRSEKEYKRLLRHDDAFSVVLGSDV